MPGDTNLALPGNVPWVPRNPCFGGVAKRLPGPGGAVPGGVGGNERACPGSQADRAAPTGLVMSTRLRAQRTCFDFTKIKSPRKALSKTEACSNSMIEFLMM